MTYNFTITRYNFRAQAKASNPKCPHLYIILIIKTASGLRRHSLNLFKPSRAIYDTAV